MTSQRWLEPSTGVLVIDADSDTVNGTLHGTLDDVTLVEVTFDDPETNAGTLVPGGQCAHITHADLAVTRPSPPSGWTCGAVAYANGTCDCGCGVIDADCADASILSCQTCTAPGSCTPFECDSPLSHLDTANNAVCDGGATSSIATSSTSSSGSGVPTGCTEVTVGGPWTSPWIATYAAPMTPDQGDSADADILGVSFGFQGGLTGTFDLSTYGDDNAATCERCVSAQIDPDGGGKQFFAAGGTIEIDPSSDQEHGVVSATLTDVTLIEVTRPDGYDTVPVIGGSCLHITSAAVSLAQPGPPATWHCDASLWFDGICHCGCGEVDPDCGDYEDWTCQDCDPPGGCNTTACDAPGYDIDSFNNAVCD